VNTSLRSVGLPQHLWIAQTLQASLSRAARRKYAFGFLRWQNSEKQGQNLGVGSLGAVGLVSDSGVKSALPFLTGLIIFGRRISPLCQGDL